MSLLDTIEKDAEAAVDAVGAFAKNDIGPWLDTVFKGAVQSEVNALLPIASSAAGALAVDLATNAGNLSKFASTASTILTSTAQQAEVASIQATGASLLAAVSSAITAHAAAVPLGGTPTPALPAALAPAPAAD